MIKVDFTGEIIPVLVRDIHDFVRLRNIITKDTLKGGFIKDNSIDYLNWYFYELIACEKVPSDKFQIYNYEERFSAFSSEFTTRKKIFEDLIEYLKYMSAYASELSFYSYGF